MNIRDDLNFFMLSFASLSRLQFFSVGFGKEYLAF